VGQGDTYEEALADVKSAIHFHIESFGEEVFDVEPPILEAFVEEAGVLAAGISREDFLNAYEKIC
jgi:hypothetical protein